MTSAEDIVRSVAEGWPLYQHPRIDDLAECVFCEFDNPNHAPDCAWRLAVEWVAECAGTEPDL